MLQTCFFLGADDDEGGMEVAAEGGEEEGESVRYGELLN